MPSADWSQLNLWFSLGKCRGAGQVVPLDPSMRGGKVAVSPELRFRSNLRSGTKQKAKTGPGWIVLSGLLALLLVACGSDPSNLVLVEASPADGFEHPYLLRLPDTSPGSAPGYLLVEPNNTGRVSDDFAVHLDAARKMASGSSLGYEVAVTLDLPLLVPAFPRPETDWQTYTHALDRDAMLITEGSLARLDLQLAAMIRHARGELAARGYPVQERVLLNGFSASGTFANRFTFLHPDLVRAVASGGINGIPMLPVVELDGEALPYPLGLADFAAIAGHPFERNAWCAVPQLLYMGADDDNDAVAYADGYSDEERAIVHAVLGETMMPDRWQRCRGVYEVEGCQTTLATYPGVGHGTNGRIHAALVEFFRSATSTD